MAIIKWRNHFNPWLEMRTLQDEINSFFNSDRLPDSTGLFDRSFSPAIDVVEADKQFTVRCELPGLAEENIDVTVSSNVLTLKGEKKSMQDEEEGRFSRKETWSGNFQRTLVLPSTVDTAGISAEFKEGILTVLIPKKDEAETRQIAVNTK